MLGTAARRRALCAAVVASAVVVGGGVANGPAWAVVDTTVVEFTGDAGDSLTLGVPRAFAPPATPVSATGSASAVQVSVGGAETWSFTFQAPQGESLAVGSTYSAVKPDAVTGQAAGFDLASSGASCTTIGAAFTVLDLVTDAGTGDVTGFAASFLSHCNGSGALSQGVVYVHSSLSYAAHSSMPVSGTTSSFAGGSVDLDGTLSGPGGPIAGASIALSRLDGAVTTNFTAAVTAADGTWAATLPFGVNDATYTAAYAGDADHTSVQKQVHVSLLQPETSTLSFSGPASTFVNTSVDLTGTLSGPGGPIGGATVVLQRTDSQGSTNLPSAVTAADGTFTASVGVGAVDATFIASYAGDAQHATVWNSWGVTAVPRATSTLTISGPASALATTTVSLSGVLSGSSGPVAGATVSLSRTDEAGTVNVGAATTGADGSWSAQVALGLTDATFRASFAGDSANDPVQSTTGVSATRDESVLTLVVPATVARGVAYTVTGVLTTDGSPLVDHQVVLRRTDLAGTSNPIYLRTDASGAYSYRDVPVVGGTVVWRASWGGDDTRQSAAVAKSVTVSRLRTVVTIRSSATAWAYGARALVTVHLGTTYNRRDVYVYARPLSWGSGSLSLIAHAKVNSKGYLVVPYKLRGRTSFIVRFDGDYRYAVASATTTTPLVKAYVSLSLRGYYHKAKSTYLFHATDPQQVITVLPLRPGRCFSTTVQAFQNGRWGTIARLSCGKLDFTSHGYTTLRSSRPLGILFRVMASVGNDSTSQSLAASSPWVYLQFT